MALVCLNVDNTVKMFRFTERVSALNNLSNTLVSIRADHIEVTTPTKLKIRYGSESSEVEFITKLYLGEYDNYQIRVPYFGSIHYVDLINIV